MEIQSLKSGFPRPDEDARALDVVTFLSIYRVLNRLFQQTNDSIQSISVEPSFVQKPSLVVAQFRCASREKFATEACCCISLPVHRYSRACLPVLDPLRSKMSPIPREVTGALKPRNPWPMSTI
jgi:ABC-type antimicrobial peptide transport system ATPase subunit